MTPTGIVIIFDLDDTLYDESNYVECSFRVVSCYLSNKYALPEKTVFEDIIQIFIKKGRRHIFETVLKKYNVYTMAEVKKCLSVYRRNIPNIKLYDEARGALEMLSEYPKYIVSDGNKNVQSIKAKALGINKYFKKILLTHRYGIKHSKPSTYCFSIIKKMERCNWNQMVYVADDPNKDFVNLNPLGIKTVRVLTGRFKDQKANSGYDAIFCINNLSELLPVLGISK
jgi:putative hydrolase of the HAD superfamily|tara:strand:+ start:156 stop:836 length:681 start_codon:yes stop_codon:yes gene_type:complete